MTSKEEELIAIRIDYHRALELLNAQSEAIAAKDATIAAQAEQIAELQARIGCDMIICPFEERAKQAEADLAEAQRRRCGLSRTDGENRGDRRGVRRNARSCEGATCRPAHKGADPMSDKNAFIDALTHYLVDNEGLMSICLLGTAEAKRWTAIRRELPLHGYYPGGAGFKKARKIVAAFIEEPTR